MTRSGAGPPKPKIVVVTCMDPRLSDLPAIFGLKHADIDVIRTGGPAVTEDVLAELLVSTRVLGSKEIMILNHTGCGFTTFTDAELNAKFSKLTGDATPAPMRFFAFKDPEQHTKEQLKMVRFIRGLLRISRCEVSSSTWTLADYGGDSLFRSSGVILVEPTQIRSGRCSSLTEFAVSPQVGGGAHGSNPSARANCFQIDPARGYRLEAVPCIPTFGPPSRRCRSALGSRPLTR